LLDFAGDLLGSMVSVDFVARVPDASRFSTGDERVLQGEDESALVRQLLGAGARAEGD
jgi:hypothetical protein